MKNIYNHASRAINRIDCALHQCVRVIPVPAGMLKLGMLLSQKLSGTICYNVKILNYMFSALITSQNSQQKKHTILGAKIRGKLSGPESYKATKIICLSLGLVLSFGQVEFNDSISNIESKCYEKDGLNFYDSTGAQ